MEDPAAPGGARHSSGSAWSSPPGDVERIFLAGWKLKLKAVAVYRDGCKRSQPVSAG